MATVRLKSLVVLYIHAGLRTVPDFTLLLVCHSMKLRNPDLRKRLCSYPDGQGGFANPDKHQSKATPQEATVLMRILTERVRKRADSLHDVF